MMALNTWHLSLHPSLQIWASDSGRWYLLDCLTFVLSFAVSLIDWSILRSESESDKCVKVENYITIQLYTIYITSQLNKIVQFWTINHSFWHGTNSFVVITSIRPNFSLKSNRRSFPFNILFTKWPLTKIQQKPKQFTHM